MTIWVCGEVLIDLIPGADGVRVGHVGGGPANTAKALARLGQDVQFIAGISTDVDGVAARKELLEDEVKLDLALTSDKPTCLAIVSLASNGSASYEFKIAGTATFDFSLDWLPDPARYKPNVLHIGTLATVIAPGADVLYDWALRVAEFAPIVFDPNIRPAVLADRDQYEAAVEKWAAISSVIKVSDDDLAWLYPGQNYADVTARWISDGAALVVVTRGAQGIIGFTSEGSVEVEGAKITVADTVGAGDTVGAIIVEAMAEKGILALTGDVLRTTLHRAVVAAGITCSRKGAQPPYKHELKGV
ncbi:carbohydrate kinase family protein [Candidatus Planktophila versatilis]|uniref:carbohydrate kinase family protein n=1 Tax=Candidatus Planktophila versatilis TaxID=1884905 RepID=UPI000BAC8B14|nr:carbohydrate kinase [Candidatus Planktophila versatilis]ASY25889.1 fructokinase [Candidatus Planktophila versatilis]